MPIDESQLRICLAVLEAAGELPADDPSLRALERASAGLRKRAQRARKRARASAAAAEDRSKLERCTRVRGDTAEQDLDEDDLHARGNRPYSASGLRAGSLRVPRADSNLHRDRSCYVCKGYYRELHSHYHSLCPSCASENWAARERRADLRGRRALVTGGRIKIGFELVAKLLRDGAEVIVVTRFPTDAARRFEALPDHAAFAERLTFVGLDLRFLPGVIELCDRLHADGRPLDILVNNAAQTIWRPPAWYHELAQAELTAISGNGSTSLSLVGPDAAAFLSQFHADCRARDQSDQFLFPAGARDIEGRQLDLRERNSWVLGLEEVDARELVEAQLVNAIAPALLCSRLRPLLDRSRFADRHVVNVSAVEGQFGYANKTPRHPHTNMAKAALNMLTRTCADDWARAGIYVNSVDTGWITQENPAPVEQRLAAAGFRPPLDVVDGAARVYDPIVRGVEGRPIWGTFLKDYQPTSW
jgi:NAD(P)-dependent dehydrogenase (short-subunit alcohol dehydrogenase family)